MSDTIYSMLDHAEKFIWSKHDRWFRVVVITWYIFISNKMNAIVYTVNNLQIVSSNTQYVISKCLCFLIRNAEPLLLPE